MYSMHQGSKTFILPRLDKSIIVLTCIPSLIEYVTWVCHFSIIQRKKNQLFNLFDLTFCLKWPLIFSYKKDTMNTIKTNPTSIPSHCNQGILVVDIAEI